MLKLLKFLIVTRFSKPILILMLAFVAYSVIIGSLAQEGLAEMGPFWTYYIISILIFVMSLMIMMGGVAIMKSDLDYIFTLPLSRRELAVSLYATQFMATGLSFLLALGYVLPYLSGGLVVKEIMVVDVVLLALLLTSMSILSFRLDTKFKALLALGMAVWGALPILGINYSYTSIFAGNLLIGTLIIIILNIPVNFLAVRELSSIELGFTKVTGRRSSIEYKSLRKFENLTPTKAIYAKHLAELNFTGRFNIGGSVSVRISRIKLQYLVIPMVAIAAIYSYVAIRIGAEDSLFSYVVLLASLYMGMFIPLIFSQEVLSHERAWLSFSSLPVSDYWKHVMASKIIQAYVMMAPFVAANIFLAILSVPGAWNAAIFTAFTVPFSTSISMYISGRISTIQVIEAEAMPNQFNLKQFLSLAPALLLSIAAIFSVVSTIFAIGIAVLYILLALYLARRKRIWDRMVYRLTESGYV